jgi:hypothetical protein
MKKTIINLLLFTITISTIFSCNKLKINKEKETSELKTTVIVDTIKGLEKIGSLLRFETVDDYVDFIEDTNQVKWTRLSQFTTNQGFQNFFTQNSNINVEDSNAMDINLGQLLNVDGVLIIGDNALKIDLPEKKVYLTSLNSLASNYQSLITGDIENKLISWFSTDDDIIDYLLYGFIEKCGSSNNFNETSNKIYPYENNTIDYITWNVNYFKSGIYFSVKIKALHYYNGFVLSDYSNVKFEVNVAPSPNWKAMRMRPRPCSGNNNVYHQGGIRDFTGFGLFGTATYPVVRLFSAYERVRGLNGYRVWIKGVYIKSPTETIKTSTWIGREVNSNF